MLSVIAQCRPGAKGFTPVTSRDSMDFLPTWAGLVDGCPETGGIQAGTMDMVVQAAGRAFHAPAPNWCGPGASRRPGPHRNGSS